MKNFKYAIAALALGATVVSTTSCREEFAVINSNPAQISKADPSMLFTQGIIEFISSIDFNGDCSAKQRYEILLKKCYNICIWRCR